MSRSTDLLGFDIPIKKESVSCFVPDFSQLNSNGWLGSECWAIESLDFIFSTFGLRLLEANNALSSRFTKKPVKILKLAFKKRHPIGICLWIFSKNGPDRDIDYCIRILNRCMDLDYAPAYFLFVIAMRMKNPKEKPSRYRGMIKRAVDLGFHEAGCLYANWLSIREKFRVIMVLDFHRLSAENGVSESMDELKYQFSRECNYLLAHYWNIQSERSKNRYTPENTIYWHHRRNEGFMKL
jgi:hypothetical protein